MTVLRKSLALVQIGAKLTKHQRQLINKLIQIAQEQAELKPDTVQFVTTFSELNKAYHSRQYISDIRDDLSQISQAKLEFNIFDTDRTQREIYHQHTVFIADLRIGEAPAGVSPTDELPQPYSASTVVMFEFPTEIRELVLEPKLWANINVEHFRDVTQLRSLLTMELVSCYHRATEVEMLPMQWETPYFNMPTLLKYYGYNGTTGELMSSYIRPSIEDLGKKTPYQITVEVQRKGRGQGLQAVRFHIQYRAPVEQPREVVPSLRQLIDEATTALKGCGVSHPQIQQYVAQMQLTATNEKYVDPNVVIYSTHYYQWAKTSPGVGKRPSDIAWLHMCIREKWRDARFDEYLRSQHIDLARQALEADLKPLEETVRLNILQRDYGLAIAYQEKWLEMQNKPLDGDGLLRFLKTHKTWLNTEEGQRYRKALDTAVSSIGIRKQHEIFEQALAKHVKDKNYHPAQFTEAFAWRQPSFLIDVYYPAILEYWKEDSQLPATAEG